MCSIFHYTPIKVIDTDIDTAITVSFLIAYNPVLHHNIFIYISILIPDATRLHLHFHKILIRVRDIRIFPFESKVNIRARFHNREYPYNRCSAAFNNNSKVNIGSHLEYSELPPDKQTIAPGK